MFVHLIKLMRVYSASCSCYVSWMTRIYILRKAACGNTYLNVNIKNLYKKARSYSVKYETGEAV